MKRVSLENSAFKTNGFFEKFQVGIWDALIDDGTPMEGSLRQFYVAERIHSETDDEIENLLARLPQELAELYRNTMRARRSRDSMEALRIGYYELDLIDFLLNVKSNRVLNLIGLTGVGKTTFLSYIFYEIRRKTDSLMRFVPITIRLTECPKMSLSDADLFQVVWQSALAALRDEVTWRGSPLDKCLEMKMEKLRAFGRREMRSVLMELIGHMKELWTETLDILEPVFIFDNVDQLCGESVAKVSSFARALFLETRMAVIIAMRPPAFATYAENDAHKGAFQNFWIELKPPSLSLYFSLRMRKVLPRDPVIVHVEGKPLTINVPDPWTAASNIAQNVLNEDNQRLVLEGIANNNVRKAGIAFCNFLRYRGLRPELLFDVSGIGALVNAPGGSYESLLTGMMLGPRMLYRDEGEAKQVVANIYHYVCPEYAPDYLIQYRTLSLLDWASKVIEVSLLVDWMRAFGYEKRHIALCIEHMLKRGLIYSPEAEYRYGDARHLAQSSSGNYYFKTLVSHRQYLWHAIPDVSLDHCRLLPDDDKEFVGRMDSILELLGRVAKQEEAQFENATSSSWAAATVGSMERAFLLQRRIITAARGIVGPTSHSRHESVRDAGVEVTEQLEKFAASARKTEGEIARFLVRANLSVPRANKLPLEFRASWAPSHEVDVRVPAVLSAADPNRVEIECRVGVPNAAGKLYGRLKSVGVDDIFDEMTELSRTGDSSVFRGSFALECAGGTRTVPDFSLSLFADSRPVLRKIFRPSAVLR